MTYRDKFIEVFNQEPDDTVCPIYCSMDGKRCPNYLNRTNPWKCGAGDWWDLEYKENDK